MLKSGPRKNNEPLPTFVTSVGMRKMRLVRELALKANVRVAAAGHSIGATALGGDWQLDVRASGAKGSVPFAPAALGAFGEILGTWSAAPSMATARIAHKATLLNDGRMLVTGGVDSTSAELYDPVNNIWSAAASMGSSRLSHTATLLPNGTVLVTGGLGAEIYNPVNNIWSPAGSSHNAGRRSRDRR